MRKNHVIFTIDYETWQPLPAGYKINWKEDLFYNANKLMDTFEEEGAKLTFMVEMCEYFWLCENNKEIAQAIEKQIQDIVLRGHDVQLHIHPNWMPECGVYTNGVEWYWNWDMASAETYPNDFSSLVQKCKCKLEDIVKAVKPDYRVLAYRAGAYRIHPFDKIYKALNENQILIDSSVYRGGISNDRGYNFNKCKHSNKPYWCKNDDAQLESESVHKIIELPITTWKRDGRLFIDNDEADLFATRFLALGKKYFEYSNNFFVFIGHSKGDHNFEAIKKQLHILKNYPNIVFSTIESAFEKIYECADKKVKQADNSIDEVKIIMQYLYENIEPREERDNDKVFGVLEKQKALCCGYAVTLYTILRQYGYKVKCITATACDMPKGRGNRKIDTHEIVELKYGGKKWILDPTTNTIIPYGINELLKKPKLAVGKINQDLRYKEREYYTYDTSFFYKRVVYYKKKRVCHYRIGCEKVSEYILRIVYNYLFHLIPDKIRFYNFYRFWRK